MLWTRLRMVALLGIAGVIASVGAGLWLQAGQAGEVHPMRAFVAQPEKPTEPKAGAEKPMSGGRIYIHLNEGAGSFLRSMEPNGEKLQSLPRADPSDDYYYQLYSACLSPDGKRLVFGLARLEVPAVYPPDKIRVRDLTKTAPGEVVVDMPGSELNRWVWSPDGKQLAFTSWNKDEKTRNWVVDIETKKIEEVKLPIVKDEKYGDHQMAICDWSPDGKSFLAIRNGIHIVKTDGTDARRLTEDVRIWDGCCKFSPDGRKVLFATSDEDFCNTLYVMDVAGGKPQPIVEAKNFMGMRACWSPDGKRIAYSVTLKGAEGKGKRGNETSLYVIDADGKNTVMVKTVEHDPAEIKMVLTDWR